MTSWLADVTGVPAGDVRTQVENLNDRLRKALSLTTPPIESRDGGCRADGIAGLLRLNERVEIEVVPKFLSEDEDWREDFFLISVLARTGRLLADHDISAGVKDRGDLATLIARTLIAGHQVNGRRPIRGYRAFRTREFSVDGDVDMESLVLPHPDGFDVQRLALTSINPHNSVLKAALTALIPQIGEGDTRVLAERVVRNLGPQPPVSALPVRLPPRHAGWQSTYELSLLVLEGFGLDLAGGAYAGPGFVLVTWRAWEQLLNEVLKRALLPHKTVSQHAFRLGTRSTRPLDVYPDVTAFGAAAPLLLADAKYRTTSGRAAAVDNGDIYEALAFMEAAGCPRTILLYPSLATLDEEPTGTCRPFDQVTVSGRVINAVTVQARGLSHRGGFEALVTGVRQSIQSMAPEVVGQPNMLAS